MSADNTPEPRDRIASRWAEPVAKGLDLLILARHLIAEDVLTSHRLALQTEQDRSSETNSGEPFEAQPHNQLPRGNGGHAEPNGSDPLRHESHHLEQDSAASSDDLRARLLATAGPFQAPAQLTATLSRIASLPAVWNMISGSTLDIDFVALREIVWIGRVDDHQSAAAHPSSAEPIAPALEATISERFEQHDPIGSHSNGSSHRESDGGDGATSGTSSVTRPSRQTDDVQFSHRPDPSTDQSKSGESRLGSNVIANDHEVGSVLQRGTPPLGEHFVTKASDEAGERQQFGHEPDSSNTPLAASEADSRHSASLVSGMPEFDGATDHLELSGRAPNPLVVMPIGQPTSPLFLAGEHGADEQIPGTARPPSADAAISPEAELSAALDSEPPQDTHDTVSSPTNHEQSAAGQGTVGTSTPDEIGPVASAGVESPTIPDTNNPASLAPPPIIPVPHGTEVSGIAGSVNQDAPGVIGGRVASATTNDVSVDTTTINVATDTTDLHRRQLDMHADKMPSDPLTSPVTGQPEVFSLANDHQTGLTLSERSSIFVNEQHPNGSVPANDGHILQPNFAYPIRPDLQYGPAGVGPPPALAAVLQKELTKPPYPEHHQTDGIADSYPGYAFHDPSTARLEASQNTIDVMTHGIDQHGTADRGNQLDHFTSMNASHDFPDLPNH